MSDSSFFLEVSGAKSRVRELFPTTVAAIAGDMSAIGFSEEGAVSDEGSGIRI